MCEEERMLRKVQDACLNHQEKVQQKTDLEGVSEGFILMKEVRTRKIEELVLSGRIEDYTRMEDMQEERNKGVCEEMKRSEPEETRTKVPEEIFEEDVQEWIFG